MVKAISVVTAFALALCLSSCFHPKRGDLAAEFGQQDMAWDSGVKISYGIMAVDAKRELVVKQETTQIPLRAGLCFGVIVSSDHPVATGAALHRPLNGALNHVSYERIKDTRREFTVTLTDADVKNASVGEYGFTIFVDDQMYRLIVFKVLPPPPDDKAHGAGL